MDSFLKFFKKNKNFSFIFFLFIFIFYYKNILLSQNCFTIEKKIVRGSSMYPLLHDGDKASTLKGYYNCHSIEREDIVLIDYPGDKNNLIIKNIILKILI